jgi:hypothetical protein
MKKIITSATILATLAILAACSPQAQAPQADDRSSENPETVIVYREEDGTGRQSTNGPQNGDSQDSSRQGEGVIIEENDGDDASDPDADDNMQSGRQLPEDFPVPVPSEYQVQAVGDVGNEVSAVLEVPSGEDAYNYYRQALADAGFRVVDEGRNQSGYFEAELEFSNNDFEGNMDFNGNTVEIDLERYA